MYEEMIAAVEEHYPKKCVLSVDEIAEILCCSPATIYNWTRRADPRRRPPRFIVGKDLRFPKKEFFKWLTEEQNRTEINSNPSK